MFMRKTPGEIQDEIKTSQIFSDEKVHREHKEVY